MEGKTTYTTNNWLRSDLSPMEQLRDVAIRACPNADRLPHMSISGGRIEVWERLSTAAGVTPKDFTTAIADVLGLKPAENLEPEASVLSRIPSTLARSEMLLPLREDADHIVLATALPFQGAGINRARFASGKPLELVIAPPEELDEAIHKTYTNVTDRISNRLTSVILDQPESDNDSVTISATEKLARSLLIKAINMRASDMHLHPYLRGSTIRFRVDGILQRIALLPDGVGERISRYFKAHGDMDPTTDQIPQDGRMSLTVEGKQYDLRVSVLPAKGGESLVVRFLEQGRVYSMSNTGLSLSALQSIRRMLSNASGVVLMTGPTGSGKSSTLYSMVSEINRIGVNIITIENPVEYQVPGITQVEVNEKAGLTFPSIIRSCMRQDPDVLLVGEIRDEETAEIAMQAAITGHLVLSTLHTNDAVTSVARLTGLGISPAILSDALVGVIAQRLVRKLCKECRTPVDEDALTSNEALFKFLSHITPSYQAQGCEACGNTGYSGRIPVAEIFEITPEIAQLVADGNTHSEQLKRENQGQNKSLAGSAARLIVSGDTTVNEAVRVIGRDFWTGLAFEYGTKAPVNLPALKEDQEEVNGILIISSDEKFISELEQQQADKQVKCLSCQTAKEASQLLHENEEIYFVVVDIDDQSDEENVNFIHNARIELYWSYLPALLLLPAGHPQLEEKLKADGAISEMLTKPVDASFVFERIKSYTLGNTA
jgi:type II secretory ATPase GspE/PulE/Tfp pilus assembly ATPase PilB-like protein